MIANTEQPRQARHYTYEEYLLVSRLNPDEAKDWLEKEGLAPGSGDVEIFIDGKRRLMSTDAKDFGTLLDM